MSIAPRLKVDAVEVFERDFKLRLPFRFGVITVTQGTQAVVRARISLADGSSGTGVAAESLAAKWFDKRPEFSDSQNVEHLRQSLEIASGHYRAHGFGTAFAHFADTYRAQLASGQAIGLLPIVASYGPALIDRAILDALGQIVGLGFPDLIARNVAGLAVTELTPDLAGFDLPKFLAGLKPQSQIAVRHTVGMLDPIVASDQQPGDRVDDGLPETLDEVIRHYNGRYYKLKVGGDLAADLDRLCRIAAVLDAAAGDYRVTLDGNEQYDSIDGIARLWRSMSETPQLKRLTAATLFIEQPIKRAVALDQPVGELARLKPLILDESDGELGSFPAGLALGYDGVSSKACKGFYKSILNAARVAQFNAAAGRPRAFMSAEDLTTLAGPSVQQDLALVGLLGLRHVERNGHHYVDGMSFASEREQLAYADAHPALYLRQDGVTRLRIEAGRLAIGSLACPGFANGVAIDVAALRPMHAASMVPLKPKSYAVPT